MKKLVLAALIYAAPALAEEPRPYVPMTGNGLFSSVGDPLMSTTGSGQTQPYRWRAHGKEPSDARIAYPPPGAASINDTGAQVVPR